MKKGNTVYEDRAEKEEARRKKRQAEIDRHTVVCPHCGKKALDHMTECPHCKGKLTPAYTPMDEKKQKAVRIAFWVLGVAAVVLFILLTILYN